MFPPEALSLRAALAEPFDASEVRWKPQAVSGNRAMAVAYVDARVIMDRLDDVFGVGGWQTSYREGKDGIICQLRVRIGTEWCVHEDIGGQSEQPDEGDRQKAAYSDSLKRVAIHLGVGRYLYRLPRTWADYDAQKKRFVKNPALPAWALPKNRTTTTPQPAGATSPPEQSPRDTAKATTEAARQERYGDRPAAATVANGANGTPPAATAPPPPLLVRLIRLNKQLVAEKKCRPGDLSAHIKEALGQKYAGKINEWPESAADDVTEACKEFQRILRERAAADTQPVSQEQLDQMEAELERTGEPWGRVLDALRLPQGVTATQLTVGQWKEAMARLGETETNSME